MRIISPARFAKSRRGYTLIEVLVVTVIITLLSGIGVAGYNNFNQTQKLKEAAEKIKIVLREAQNASLSGQKESVICAGADSGTTSDDFVLDYWEVNFASDSFTIFGVCSDPDDPLNTLQFMETEYTLNSSLVIGVPADTVRFGIDGQEVSGVEKSITISHVQTTNTLTVKVSPAGEIYYE